MCLNREKRYKLINFFRFLSRKLWGTYRDRAGCVILKKITDDKFEVLLITCYKEIKNNSKKLWKLPAGGVEKGEKKEEAAKRETFEEAGAKGKVQDYLWYSINNKRMTRTYSYLMIDPIELAKENQYEEGIKGRKRKWFDVNEAMNLIPEDQLPHLQKALEVYKKNYNNKNHA